MIITVASGKGGTGKTTVATNLAASLKMAQYIDADVECPNSPRFLNPTINYYKKIEENMPKVNEQRCTACGECANVCQFNAIIVIKDRAIPFQNLCTYCGACKLVCPEKAITDEPIKVGEIQVGKFDSNHYYLLGKVEIGQLETVGIINELKKRVNTEVDVIIDSPPGSAHPAITAMRDSDFVVLVSESTPFGLKDLQLTLEVIEDLGVPYGVVINKYGLGDKSLEKFCDDNAIPILAKIPWSKNLERLYSEGKLISRYDENFKKIFINLFDKIGKIKDANDNDN